MDDVVVNPRGALRGSVRLPGDKSISHRALLLNTLASGPAHITGLLDSADVRATAAACRALGADIEVGLSGVTVRPPERLVEPADVVDCGNSGTSMRLLAGVVAAEPMHVVLTGDASLSRRPMGRIAHPLRALGAHIDGRDGGRLAPLSIRGPVQHALELDLPVASAQVKTAVLLAARRVGVTVGEPLQQGVGSRDHTERMLRRMGASLEGEGGRLRLEPVERLDPVDVDVPADLSSAAFFLVAASLVPGSEVLLHGVGVNPTRTGVLDALQAMGADIAVRPHPSPGEHAEPIADLVVRSSVLRGARIDGALALRCLDELPVLAVAAAFAEGETVIADAAELRVKESDRIARTAAGLRALGADVEERPDGLLLGGGLTAGQMDADGIAGARIDCTGDHRIAMAFAVAGLLRGPVHLAGADVSTSYPQFFADLEGLLGS